jgi:predicted transglutaminase-like cysteine proteinase
VRVHVGWRVVVLLALVACGAARWAEGYDAARMRRAAERQGALAMSALPELEAVLAAPAPAEPLGQLAVVNGFFNRRIAFVDDQEAWGQLDHWASPFESLGKGRGDCEDYAIAKYFSLVALGVPVQRLRLVYVRVRMGDTSLAHMVLAYYERPDAEPLILDNLVTTVYPASRRTDLTAVFSFNTEGLWQGTGSQSAGDAQARLSRWREVVAKAHGEGFI